MDNYLGEIKQFAGGYAPEGWALCDGRLLPIDKNEALYGLIGITYGGDGVNNFGLPDLRGRVPVHVNDSFPLGVKSGHEEVTLREEHLPAHSHVVYASGADGNLKPENSFWGATSTEFTYSALAPNAKMNKDSTQPAGGGEPHENRIPFITISFIIALTGIYPPHS